MTTLRTTLLTTAIATALALPALADARGQGFLDQWDANGDGRVTLAEAVQHRAETFATFDADDSGTLDTVELAAMNTASDGMRRTMRAGQHAEGRQGKGPRMGQHEGMGQHDGMGQRQGKMMGQHGGQGRMGHGQQPQDHAAMDADGDGLLSLAEFTDATADWFQRRDRSGDGAITADDFGPRF